MHRELKVNDFKEKHVGMYLVEKIDKPHPVLEDNRPIEVYCDDIIMDGHKTWFWLFNDDIYVGNPITFSCSISEEDKRQIGQDMINELLSCSDFHDLNLEFEGKVPCEEYRNKYKKCDECEKYRYGKGKDSEDACIGSMYSIPTHVNWWQKTEGKWKKVYGEKTKKHKEYIVRKMIGYMNDFMHVCGKEEKMIKEVLKYGKNHCANQFPELFR